MSPLYCLQFFLFSCCVHLFTLFSFFVYYTDRFHSHVDLQEEYDYVIGRKIYREEIENYEFDIMHERGTFHNPCNHPGFCNIVQKCYHLVGSGTAGSLIAHRLATETNHTFIVLEAGARGHALLEIPVLGPFLHRSLFDWQYESAPQKHACWAMEGNKCRLPQGKIVGGSSKLNNMIHIRGNVSHYVDWFYGKHNKEYIESQFEFIEKVISTDDIQYQSELANAVMDAAKELGYNILSKDFKQGFIKSKVSQKNGKRYSTSDKVLTKDIISNAFVESVIFDGNIANGVHVNLFDKKYQIRAREGVILSAGSINTPKILQLSGVGPESLLKSLNIPIVKVLPVGKNLQDHVATGMDLVLFNKSVSIQTFDMLNPVSVFQYFFNGKGPLTTSGCEAVGFVSTKDDKVPDIQFMVLPVGLSSDRGSLFSKNLGIKANTWQRYFAKTFHNYVATVLPVVLHPKSTGEVYITSRDPTEPPIFDPKYLSSQDDIDTLIKGLKIMIKLIETDVMKKLGAYLNPIVFPGCEDKVQFSDSYFECYIRHLTLTSYHPVGTCSMGLPGSKNSVVDSSFKVFGVKRLYVADASVLPTLPSGNINAAVAMMASVFFDSNIAPQTILSKRCSKSDYLYENVFHVCVVR